MKDSISSNNGWLATRLKPYHYRIESPIGDAERAMELCWIPAEDAYNIYRHKFYIKAALRDSHDFFAIRLWWYKKDNTPRESWLVDCGFNGTQDDNILTLSPSDCPEGAVIQKINLVKWVNYQQLTFDDFQFCVVDLTQTFGAGKEPTIEECREIFKWPFYAYNVIK